MGLVMPSLRHDRLVKADQNEGDDDDKQLTPN